MAKVNYYFVLWSGGLDSTYLIYDLLQKGHHVNAGYCTIKNNPEKTKRELAAIDKMLPFLKGFIKFDYYGVMSEINLEKSDGGVILRQVPLFILTLISCVSRHDYCCLGYVMNDDAISYLPDIQRMYNVYNGFTNEKLAKLIFPLAKTDKQEIINKFPKEIFEFVTRCESDSIEVKADCDCHSCKRWRNYKQKEVFKFQEEIGIKESETKIVIHSDTCSQDSAML